ncbi:DUF3696 domain-containing protein [Rhodanobacter sp. IGA1.0]|uniref:DUF3696 domain-containing protein n=1 Tax=Rhodanobacter sp. IGA1.0 TaxID=3158582 RepID=A0AAU7QGY4_9GAMM
MSEIVGPIEIDATELPDPMVSLLKFRQPGGEWVRAPNMGFGVSYALPIVAGGLSAISGGLFIVENPEAHLHPAGQSTMGVFLAWLASKGVQVILETHSDHVINGIRLAVGKMKYIACEAVSLLFFDSSESGLPLVQRISVSDRGTLSDWPEYFFDQYQIDVAELGRIRRSK